LFDVGKVVVAPLSPIMLLSLGQLKFLLIGQEASIDLFRLLLVVKQNVDIYERNDYSRGIFIIQTYFLYNISYVSNPSI
jgi:hypothetical protein